MDAVRHSLGFAEDSDARAARIVGAVCSMAGAALDRRLLNAGAAPGEGQLEGNGRHCPSMSVDHSPTGLRGCVVILEPLDVRITDGVRRCPRRQGENVFSRNSAELVLKTPAPAESSLKQYRLHWIGKALRQCKSIGDVRGLARGMERSNLSVTAVLTIWWLLEDADCSIPMRSATRLFEKFLECALSYAEIPFSGTTLNSTWSLLTDLAQGTA